MMSRCIKCGHVWDYKGESEFYISCPRCKTPRKRDIFFKEYEDKRGE